jgi:hypothetical protein
MITNFGNIIAMALGIILAGVLVYFICLCIACTTIGIIKGIKEGLKNKTKSVQEVVSSEKESSNKTKVSELYIIVDEGVSTEEKPYYELLYKEVGADHRTIGYGSYSLEQVLQWKKEAFEKVKE